MSQWIGEIAIDTTQLCDKQPGSILYKIQQNLDLLHNIQVVGKYGYFNSKTESSETS